MSTSIRVAFGLTIVIAVLSAAFTGWLSLRRLDQMKHEGEDIYRTGKAIRFQM